MGVKIAKDGHRPINPFVNDHRVRVSRGVNAGIAQGLERRVVGLDGICIAARVSRLDECVK